MPFMASEQPAFVMFKFTSSYAAREPGQGSRTALGPRDTLVQQRLTITRQFYIAQDVARLQSKLCILVSCLYTCKLKNRREIFSCVKKSMHVASGNLHVLDVPWCTIFRSDASEKSLDVAKIPFKDTKETTAVQLYRTFFCSFSTCCSFL